MELVEGGTLRQFLAVEGRPWHDTLAVLLQAGEGLQLPGAVALDDSLGRETLYLVHCPANVEPRCSAPAVGPGSDAAPASPACPAGCSLTAFVLNKSR